MSTSGGSPMGRVISGGFTAAVCGEKGSSKKVSTFERPGIRLPVARCEGNPPPPPSVRVRKAMARAPRHKQPNPPPLHFPKSRSSPFQGSICIAIWSSLGTKRLRRNCHAPSRQMPQADACPGHRRAVGRWMAIRGQKIHPNCEICKNGFGCQVKKQPQQNSNRASKSTLHNGLISARFRNQAGEK